MDTTKCIRFGLTLVIFQLFREIESKPILYHQTWNNGAAFTRMDYEGNSLQIWKIKDVYYVIPLGYLQQGSVKYLNTLDGTKSLQFSISLMTSDLKKSTAFHLRKLTEDCVTEQSVALLPVEHVFVTFKIKQGVAVIQTWNMSVEAKQNELSLTIPCPVLPICKMFEESLMAEPDIEFQFKIDDTVKTFKIRSQNGNGTNRDVATRVEDIPCKTGIEKTVAKILAMVLSMKNDIKLLKSKHLIGVGLDDVIGNDGWIVFLRRKDGSETFRRNWEEYKTGFGDKDNEFWLGNEKLHQLTSDVSMKLRIDMWTKDNTHTYGEWSTFAIGPETDGYRLKVSTDYKGNLIGKDRLNYGGPQLHNNQKFTTIDRDNDKNDVNCADLTGGGGWWYNNCDAITLTDVYDVSNKQFHTDSDIMMQRVEMKMRRI